MGCFRDTECDVVIERLFPSSSSPRGKRNLIRRFGYEWNLWSQASAQKCCPSCNDEHMFFWVYNVCVWLCLLVAVTRYILIWRTDVAALLPCLFLNVSAMVSTKRSNAIMSGLFRGTDSFSKSGSSRSQTLWSLGIAKKERCTSSSGTVIYLAAYESRRVYGCVAVVV